MITRKKLYIIIFESDTPAGKAFDIALLWAILLSVLAVILESVVSLNEDYGTLFTTIEWVLTIGFSLEFMLRLYVSEKPLKYAFSFYGIIDLLAVLPAYVSLVFSGTQYLLIIRALRLLRVFRILKLGRFVGEGEELARALKGSRHKIIVFLGLVITVVMIAGTAMYMIEGGENGFSSIPVSMYWAIVTLTTVGYGDIAPQTVIGQALASFIMVMGYAIIAVPTGIVTSELVKDKNKLEKIKCANCNKLGHDANAAFCKYCGEKL
ncbi:MAG: voltage-gated potassium channel [Roseivirga sp.]|jgi:voltage-gated potassium channel